MKLNCLKTAAAVALVSIAGAAALPATAQTQTQTQTPAQTAAGAQTFLQTIFLKGAVKAYVVGKIAVRVHCTKNGTACGTPTEQSRRYDWSAKTIEQGATACQTVATSYPVKVNVHDTPDGPILHSFQAVQEPAVLVTNVDWGASVIKRGGYHRGSTFMAESIWDANVKNVTVEYRDRALNFVTEDPAMLDRIEYAMKFLQMSCDTTTETGF